MPEIISPEGFNVDRIPITKLPIKQLSEINGVNASAKAALSELDPILKELDASTQELLDVETEEDLDNIKRFAERQLKYPTLFIIPPVLRNPTRVVTSTCLSQVEALLIQVRLTHTRHHASIMLIRTELLEIIQLQL
ncbi:MAG: hypothetical protein CM15mP62_11520 [Rhodospirillaceae bacterium]|nr:MAG: hypothetical protein CM15mP62_11520 [Rhodospirillaceae bacterium]